MSADAGWFGIGGTSWKEEVLLHDGSKVVAERWQNYGGRHEIGQAPPIKEQTITFVVSATNERVTWKSEYGEELGRTNFIPIALHILNGTPYIVATPYLCLSYNKWGRPNPPYVIFKHDKDKWQRISLQELPIEFKEVNLVVSTKGEEKTLTAESVVTALKVRKLNHDLRQLELRAIMREPVTMGAEGSAVNCVELVFDGKGGWIGLDWFTSQPNYDACLKVCERKGISPQYCPCNRIFGRK